MTRIIERPVFIFHGGSCLCKSFIAASTGLKVYETDISEHLPEKINEEIIVVGNRSRFGVDDVISKIVNKDFCKIIKVGFEGVQ